MTPRTLRRGFKRVEPIGTLEEQEAFYLRLFKESIARLRAERDAKVRELLDRKKETN